MSSNRKVGMHLTFGSSCLGKESWKCLSLTFGVVVLFCCRVKRFKRNVVKFGLLGTRSCARVWILDFGRFGFSHLVSSLSLTLITSSGTLRRSVSGALCSTGCSWWPPHPLAATAASDRTKSGEISSSCS